MSIGGAEFGPLSVSRFPTRSVFVADFRASPAHAPGAAASGTPASAAPAPARLRSCRRSKHRVVLSSLTWSSFVRRVLAAATVPPRRVVVKIVANLVDRPGGTLCSPGGEHAGGELLRPELLEHPQRRRAGDAGLRAGGRALADLRAARRAQPRARQPLPARHLRGLRARGARGRPVPRRGRDLARARARARPCARGGAAADPRARPPRPGAAHARP